MNKLSRISLSLLIIGSVQHISADSSDFLPPAKVSEIEYRVNAMSADQLFSKRADLSLEEQNLQKNLMQLEEQGIEGQALSEKKVISKRLAEIGAELTSIQKAIVALLGVGAINVLTSDKYTDDVPPVITITGSATVTVELGDSYSDAGATALDVHHGTTSVTTSGSVNTNAVGSYTITYSATDKDNNTATATRTVNVVDTTAPVITVTGTNPATTELGETYTDAGATVTDESGAITAVTTGTVDTSTVGTYILTYTATDASTNSSTATRTVNVVDTTAPAITVTGSNPATVELGGTYTDAGATVTDASGTVTIVTTGVDTVKPNTLGTYTITYTSTDASSNVGTATRTVNVTDTVVPVFTSGSTFTVDEGATAVGTVTATDIQAVSFSLSGSDLLQITTAGVLSFKSPADYESQSTDPVTLPYDGSTYNVTATVTATDASSNAATQLVTVRIRDFGGIDDDDNTGTGTDTATGTSTGTGTGSSTGTGTGTSTGTGTGTGTDTSTATGTGTSTSTSTGTGTGTGTDTSTSTSTSTGTST